MTINDVETVYNRGVKGVVFSSEHHCMNRNSLNIRFVIFYFICHSLHFFSQYFSVKFKIYMIHLCKTNAYHFQYVKIL
jgi:hypothetical protein